MKTILFYGNKNIIAEKVRKERERIGLSQEALAARLQIMDVGIDQQAISKIERNMRTVTDYEVFCFAEVFGISADEILRGGSQYHKKTN